MHLGSVHVHVETQLLTDGLDVLQTLLVVGTGTTDPDLDLVLVQDGGNLTQSADDTLEGRGDVGEVGNTTTDEEDLAVGVGGGAQHQVEDRAGIVEGLGLGGSTGVLTVVGELADEASRGNGIGIHDGSTTTSDQSPDTAVGVQDGQLEGSTGLGIHVGDELLLLAQLTTERSGELHGRAGVDVDLIVPGGSGQTEVGGAAGNRPLGAALELGGLVQLRSQIQEVNLSGGGIRVGDDHQRVDFQVGELAVDVDGIQAGDEVHQDIVDTLGHLVQQRSGNLLVGGVLLEVDGDEELLGLRVDITNVDTTLVSEEDPVALETISPGSMIVAEMSINLPHARS